ncbi:Uncharacterized protein Adt_03777 [Abeliophyllum distichum]|uniref:Uncharacterized protein n=1 Tax=Abeliophyllum distichum TaxID=126358 RepID=A0ABD1VZI1_9LAMI
MLFCERITDAEALSTLKRGLDVNLPFWRDVRNKNPTTFDQLVKMITEEITNENMILYRNHGGIAPNQMPRMNYGKYQDRQLPQPHQCRRDYPADPNSGISYVASAQEGLLPPYPIQGTLGPSTGAYNYGMTVPTYYEVSTSALSILSPRQKNAQQVLSCPPKLRAQHGRVPRSPDRRSQQWDRRPSNQELQRRNSRSPARHPRIERVPEYRLLKGPEKVPIYEIDTIYGGPYIVGKTRNAQKSYAKEVEGKLMTNWLINSRPSWSSKVDHISFTEEDMRRLQYPHCDALVVRTVVARNGLGRMLVDNRSSVNVIFLSTYEQMNIDVPLKPSTEPLYGFTGDCITPKERRTSGYPHFHGFLSGRQKISLPRSLRPTRLERALGCDIYSPPLHEVPH